MTRREGRWEGDELRVLKCGILQAWCSLLRILSDICQKLLQGVLQLCNFFHQMLHPIKNVTKTIPKLPQMKPVSKHIMEAPVRRHPRDAEKVTISKAVCLYVRVTAQRALTVLTNMTKTNMVF